MRTPQPCRDLAFRVGGLVVTLALGSARTNAQDLIAVGFSGGAVEVFSLEPVTGSVVPLVATGAADADGGWTALDRAGRRLFFQSSGGQLYTVSLSTGIVTQAPLATCCYFLEYDRQAATLLGVGFQGGQVEVFGLNPSTGAATPLIATGAPDADGGWTAFDAVGRRLFFQSTNNQLYTVNFQNNTVTQAPLAACCYFLQFGTGAVAAVPTTSRAALLLVIVALGIVAIVVLHR